MTQNGATPETPAYPLMEHGADALHAASGRAINAIDLEAAAGGELSAADLRIGAETLRAQAAIARQAGYRELADNLVRAAELTAVPNAELLRMYEMLRPGRSTFEEMMSLAETLESQYEAVQSALFVREAAEVYRLRNLARRA